MPCRKDVIFASVTQFVLGCLGRCSKNESVFIIDIPQLAVSKAGFFFFKTDPHFLIRYFQTRRSKILLLDFGWFGDHEFNTVEEEQSNSLEMTGNESGCLAFRRRRATTTVLQLFSQIWLTMTFVLYLGHEKFLTSS